MESSHLERNEDDGGDQDRFKILHYGRLTLNPLMAHAGGATKDTTIGLPRSNGNSTSFRHAGRMRSEWRIQIIGPLALLAAVLAAEAAAFGLGKAPTSAFLWYLNLEVFSALRRGGMLLPSELGALPFAQVVLVAGLTLLGVAGVVLKRKLMVALSSNLSFVYAAFLLYGWHYWHSIGKVKSASLALVYAPVNSELWLFGVLLLASALSFAASHFLYFRSLRTAD